MDNSPPLIEKGVKKSNTNSLLTYLKNTWTKRRPVKVNQLSDFERQPFLTGLVDTPITSTLFETRSQKGLTVKNL